MCAGLALAGEGPQPTDPGRAARGWHLAHAPPGSTLPCPSGSTHRGHSHSTGKSQGHAGPQTLLCTFPVDKTLPTITLGAQLRAKMRLSRGCEQMLFQWAPWEAHSPGWVDTTVFAMHTSHKRHTWQKRRNALSQAKSPQSHLGARTSQTLKSKTTAKNKQPLLFHRACPTPLLSRAAPAAPQSLNNT